MTTEPREARGPEPGLHPSVLIANVDPCFGEVIFHRLRARGWNVTKVADPREALGRWNALGARLVVTDLDGADMDGFEFLRALSYLDPCPEVVVRAPHAGDLDRRSLLALGIVVVGSPCRFDSLETALACLASAEPPFPARS